MGTINAHHESRQSRRYRVRVTFGGRPRRKLRVCRTAHRRSEGELHTARLGRRPRGLARGVQSGPGPGVPPGPWLVGSRLLGGASARRRIGLGRVGVSDRSAPSTLVSDHRRRIRSARGCDPEHPGAELAASGRRERLGARWHAFGWALGRLLCRSRRTPPKDSPGRCDVNDR